MKRLGLAVAILLLAVSTATVAGKIAHRIGVSRLHRGDIPGTERMFRIAIGVDPFCDTYPDAMAALGHRLYLAGARCGNPDPLRAESLLTESIRWEAKAVSLSPRDFQKTTRLSRLFVDRYRVTRRQEDLGASIDWAGRALEINPYSAEKLWDRAELLILDRRPIDAEADLSRAVSIEPNFCRGYAKLAVLTKGKDEPQSRAWETRAEKCREAARGRSLEENERWLVDGTRTRVEDGGGEERGRGARFAVWLLPVALILLSAAVSDRVTSVRTQAVGRGNSPSVLGAISRRPALSFGFPNLLGDLVWLEAVQVSGNRKMTRDDYDHLSDLLSTVIRFDPRFMVPYLLGGILLGDSPDHADAALDLLARGEKQFPSEWLLPFYTGYVQYFSLGNPEEGGMALLRAARIPGSPEYFPMLASRMLSEGHRPDTALAFLREMMERETDPRRKVSLEERIRRVIVERDLQSMEGAIAEYTSNARGFRSGNSPTWYARVSLPGSRRNRTGADTC